MDVLVNKNNIYYDNKTSPRKQHFSASLYLLGHELKRSNKDGGSILLEGNTVLSAFSQENPDLHLKTFSSSAFVSSFCHWKNRWNGIGWLWKGSTTWTEHSQRLSLVC